MARITRNVVIASLAGLLVLAAVGCGGPSLEEEFTAGLQEQGLGVKSLEVDVTPHEAQVMMDLMILESHGITNAVEGALVHATVVLDNGEEVSAVKYDGQIYTYNQE